MEMSKTELIELLKDARKTLSMAFYADYKVQNQSDEICAKIDKFMYEIKEDKKHESIKY